MVYFGTGAEVCMHVTGFLVARNVRIERSLHHGFVIDELGNVDDLITE